MIRDYINLITPEHQNKPNFAATIGVGTQSYADEQALLESMPLAFDLDYAVGAQLDAVGLRIGLSRDIKVPLANQYFTWSDPIRGWGRGFWYDAAYGNEYGVTRLDDDTFRVLLYAKILANNWDGTLPGAQAIVDKIFSISPSTLVVVQDDSTSASQNNFFAWDDAASGWSSSPDSFTYNNFDNEFSAEFAQTSPDFVQQSQWFTAGSTLTTVESVHIGFTIGVAGKLPPLALLFLLEQQLVPIKSVGAPVDYAFTSLDGAPLFGWGIHNNYISGWSEGAWGVDAETILNAPPGSIYPLTEAA